MASAPFAVVVAGPPGAGKTTFTTQLCSALSGAPVDKDTITGPVVAAAMAAAGLPPHELDHPYYKEHLRGACYTAMEDVASQIAGCGTTPVLCAPYASAVSSGSFDTDLAGRLGVERVEVVWITASFETLRRRIESRGAPRDVETLRTWGRFITLAHLGPPSCPHTLVVTDQLDVMDLGERAASIAWDLLAHHSPVVQGSAAGTWSSAGPAPAEDEQPPG